MIIHRKCLALSTYTNRIFAQTVPRRNNATFPLWRTEAAAEGVEVRAGAPTLILCGYAGSSRSQLEKYGSLYSSLGYSSISAILPHSAIYSYDIPQIQDCAAQIIHQMDRSACRGVVCHTFSNNGAALYQQIHTLLASQGRTHLIQGLILDSGPGPMGALDHLKKSNYLNNQSFVLLPVHMFLVNRANKLGLKENIGHLIKLLRKLPRSYWSYRNVPWAGQFISNHERGAWPLLLFYSKEDKLLHWKYAESLIGKQKSSGVRRVESHLFQGSGHVAHFKRHPKLYTQLVQTFMDSVEQSPEHLSSSTTNKSTHT